MALALVGLYSMLQSSMKGTSFLSMVKWKPVETNPPEWVLM